MSVTPEGMLKASKNVFSFIVLYYVLIQENTLGGRVVERDTASCF